MTGPLPDGGLPLNPDAANPPFPWHVVLPQSWAVLDTHPASWQRNLERLVDERLAGRRLKAADRRQVLAHLEDLVINAQRGGVLLSLAQISSLGGGAVAAAGLHLAWYDSAPEHASLATVRQAAGRKGVVEEIDSEAGVLLLQRTHMTVAPPGSTTRRGLTSLQAFLPLPGHTWTAIVATASAHPELTGTLRDLVLTVAGSIRPLDEAPTGPQPDGMVLRRIDPAAEGQSN